MILARVGLGAKTVPGRHTIVSDLSVGYALLEKLKRRAQTLPELFRRYGSQLRLRIVNVVDVDAGQVHVRQRLPELALQIPRRHAVRAAGDICEARDPGLHESLFDVLPNIARRLAVKRQVTALGANHDLVTRKSPLVEFSQGCANRSFTSLKTIIGGCVDDVRAQFNGARETFGIPGVGLVVGVAQ